MSFNFPNSPAVNDVYPSTGTPIYRWNGQQWISLSGPLVYVADTAPTNVPVNSLWWESDTGMLYVRYNDGNSTQWVVTSPTPNLNGFVAKAGDTMAGPLNVPAGATGTQVPRIQDVVQKTGDTMTGSLLASPSGTPNLGSASNRWGTVFTSDLSLKNEHGDWTIVEGEDDLFITNNKTSKKYKFVLTEV